MRPLRVPSVGDFRWWIRGCTGGDLRLSAIPIGGVRVGMGDATAATVLFAQLP